MLHRLVTRLRSKFGLSDIISQTLFEAYQALDRIRELDEPGKKRWLRRMLVNNLLQEIEYVLRQLNMLAEASGKAMSVLQRGVSVRGVRELSNDEVRRLETDWNAVFTKLGLMQGQLKARRKELAEQTTLNYYLNRFLRRPATAH